MKDESDTILTLTNFMQRVIVDDSDTDFDDSPAYRKPTSTDKADSGDASKQQHSVARQQSNQDSESDLEVVMVPQRLAVHEPSANASAPARSDATQEEIPLNDLAASSASSASIASNSTLTRTARGASSARSVSEASVEQATELDENADPTRTATEQTVKAAAALPAAVASEETSGATSTAGDGRERAGSVEELDDERNRVRIDEFEFVQEESLADAIYDISTPQPPDSFRSWTRGAFMGFTLVLFESNIPKNVLRSRKDFL